MSKKIKLGNVYYTAHGKPFIPVTMERGKLKKNSINFWADQQAREPSIYIDKEGNRIRKNNLYLDKFGYLKIGHVVSHEDYSSEEFVIISIDKQQEMVYTKGGKNGTWDNHIDLIIRLGKNKKSFTIKK